VARRQIYIYTALQIEAHAVATAMLNADVTVSIQVVGIRASALPVIKHGDRALIILAGLAGGLDPSLGCGDVVVDDPSGILPCRTGSGLHFGPIHNAHTIVATPVEKSELVRTTRALAVDMESEVVRRAAEKAGADFIVVRAISDTADQRLDPALPNLIDAQGRVRPLPLASILIRRPRIIVELLRARARARVALDALGNAISSIIASCGFSTADIAP
jgi:nucleoside phosphorylase